MGNLVSKVSASTRKFLLYIIGDKNLEQMKKELNKINWDEPERALEEVREIFENYQSNENDWKKFCHSNGVEGYSRNEIVTVPNKYTMILMFWKPRKGNFIHNHGGSHGLVKILKGSLVEEHYTYHPDKAMRERLQEGEKIILGCNKVNNHLCFKDFHRMHNPDETKDAVSLHVYAPPLETCTIINKESNVTEVVQMKYTSTRGEKTTKPEINELADDLAYVSHEDKKLTDNKLSFSCLRDVIQKLDQLNWTKHKAERKKDIRKILEGCDAKDCECEWSKYCKISTDEEYSRTIIYNSKDFTLSLNFYKPGADCLPHDHDGADCIYKVLEGQLEETHFNVNESNGDLELVGEPKNHVENEVNDTEGSEGYHSNRNPRNENHAITLNVFTSPDVKCRVYEPESKSSYNIEPTLHTTDGLRRRKPATSSEPERVDPEYKTLLKAKSVKKPHQKDRKHTIRQTASRIAVTCLSFIALVFALTAIVILCMEMNGNAMTQDFQPASEVKQYSRFCFKCALVGDYPDHHPKNNPLLEMLNNLTRHKIDDHNSQCCVENDEQFKALVAFLSASLITEQDVKFPNKLPPMTPVSAHKYLLPEQHSTDKKFGEHFPLTFNTSSHDPSYEHVRGVDVTKDGFIVQVTGLYYVYSSIKFKREPATDKTLYHYLHRISFNNPMQTGVLLRSVHTICQDCIRSQETSFAGGIFYLQSGDKLQVCVSAPGVVDEQREAMYMGLAMLKS